MPRTRKGDTHFPNRVTSYLDDDVYKDFEKVMKEYPIFGASKHVNAALRWYTRDVLKFGLDANLHPLGHVKAK